MTHKVAHRISTPCTIFWPVISPLVTQHTYRVVQVVTVSCTVRKNFIWTRLNLNGYRDWAAWISRPNSVRFLFVLDEEWSLQKKGGYRRQIVRLHFGCCCPHKETLSSTQTNNTQTSHKLQSAVRFTVRFLNIYCEL